MLTAADIFIRDDGRDGPTADTPSPNRCRPHRMAPGVKALRVTRYNKIAAMNWLGGQGCLVRGGVGVFDGTHYRSAYEGDWIIKPFTGRPYVLPHEAFVRLYETC